MITKEINLYEYSELSENAKNRIRDKWRSYGVMDGCNSDYENTLNEFCELCDIKVRNWEVSDWNYSFRIQFSEKDAYATYDKRGYVDEYIMLRELSGKLLFRYVYNYIIPSLIKGKYHSTSGYYDENQKYHYEWRRSRVVMEDEPEKGSCPLTGFCMDCDIIEPLMKYYRNWAKYPEDYTYEDLMNECLDSFFNAWQKEWEYRLSDEAVDEDIENNWDNKLFFADGTEFDAA